MLAQGCRPTRIISSPFRRCLQTAGIVARELGLTSVDVHCGLGEAMAMVQRCGWPDPGPGNPPHQVTSS
jgi:hypothetical protein